MSGNSSIHAVDDTNTLDSGKEKWIPVKTSPTGNLNSHIKQKDNEPEQWADGNTSGTVATSGTFSLGDLTIYGFPYQSVTFTETGVNSFTVIWGVAQGALFFTISGSGVVNLTATNTNGNTFTDVTVIEPQVSANPVTGQGLNAGHYVLYRN